MQLVSWNPFRELEGVQARLNRLLGDVPPSHFEETTLFGDWSPAVDVEETDKEFVVKADLPDVRKEDIKVQLADGILTVEGERHQEKEEKGKKFHKVERAYGRFLRRFELPTGVDAVKIEASFKDGVLNVHLPKTEVAKPKAIDVKVA